MDIVKKDYLNPKNFTQDHDKARRVRDLIDKMKKTNKNQCYNP